MPVTGPTAQNSPDFFVGKTLISAYEPYPSLTGSLYSSIPPASGAVFHWNQPVPVVVKNVVVQNSFAAGVPGATAQASSGSEVFSYAYSALIYSRQDYTANSTNITPVISGSFGLTASLSYTSTAQTFGMSWVTDTTGGNSTFSTTSNDAGWSNFASGAKVLSIPIVSTLPPAEYWMVFQHSSSTATSNSNVTLMSASQFLFANGQWNPPTGVLGGSVTGAIGANQDVGVMTAVPAFSLTVALSNISNVSLRPAWFALSGA